MSELKIKICGMKEPGNVREISRLLPDYMGFIHYSRSRRYAGELPACVTADLPPGIRRTGVFVDHAAGEVLAVCRRMGYHCVQLHGTESPEYCRLMKDEGLEVFKVFSIGEQTSFSRMRDYLDSCDLFLLDTAGKGFGGTGKKFDWNRLEDYALEKPFFLSGGVGPRDAAKILGLAHPRLFGVDLNSRFELEPGIKDRDALAGFIGKVRKG